MMVDIDPLFCVTNSAESSAQPLLAGCIQSDGDVKILRLDGGDN
jgi:hypothetical protein